MKWDPLLYDQKHGFVSKFGEDLIDWLAPVSGENILDVGCGTGDLAELINQRQAQVSGIDHSEEMIISAKNKYPHLTFYVMKAEEIQFHQKFDAVFSNASLHWVQDKEQVIQSIYDCLTPHGRFVAEFGGKGNVENIINALRDALFSEKLPERAKKTIWYFPSLGEYTSLLEGHGFRVTLAAHFDRHTYLYDHTGLRNWVLMFGKAYLDGLDQSTIDRIISRMEVQLKNTNYDPHGWFADYVRLRFVAIKYPKYP